MQWLILGAGALGGYFGARLVEAGEDVTFLLRERRMAQMQSTGLVVQSAHGDVHIKAPTCVRAEDVTDAYDVVILGCKAYDLDAAMDAIAPAVGAQTAILPILNGMRHIERLCARFGAPHVLGGLCMISAALDAEGHVQHLNDLDDLVYGELDGGRTPRIEAMDAVFGKARFTARASDSIVQEMWEKWIFIAAMAGATCLMRAATCDIVKAGAGDIATGILDECAAIAAAQGFAPRAERMQYMHQYLINPQSTLTASMLKDVERGARTEGEHVLDDLLARAPADEPAPRLLGIAAANLRAYAARREREHAAAATDRA